MIEIELNNVKKNFGLKNVLDGVSFEVKTGERISLIGENGSGKSTLLKTLNRMNDLVECCRIYGKVTLDGKDIYKNYDINLLRKNVGMVFQKPNPFPKTIYENIVYAPKLHGEKDKNVLMEMVETSLKSVALWDEVKDKLHKSAMGLSGGQQQRLCIARAIAIKPEVILMDEPTSALDPLSTLKIEELIRELEKNYTIVIVTHNMQQAARISDKTAFFYKGVIEEFDSTSKIFTNPSNKKTEDYVNGKFS